LGLKVAVVGGGSTYTPELIEGITDRVRRLPVTELVLEDRDPDRLAIVGGLAQRMVARREWPGQLSLTTDLDEAIDGAAFVLVQLRVGGQNARLVDETLPPRFGTIGQETTGAGGLAKALRTVPVVLDIADRVRRRGAPDGWLIDFTNPVGIVTQALLDAGHRAIGLCNVGIGFQRRMAKLLGVSPDDVTLEHVGLNHLSWERGVRLDGTDRLPGLLAANAEDWAEEVHLPVERLREMGALPSYYLRYYYGFDAVLSEQSARRSRAEEVIDIERRLLEMYRDPTLDEKPALLADRGGAFYSEAAAQLLASLHDGSGDTQVVDVRNDGAIPGLADDDVVEISATIDTAGAHPLPQRPLDGSMLDLVRDVKRYERLAISAALSGDRADVKAALEANPLVGPRIGDVEPLLDALLDANRAHLPRFFAAT
jgi:6-phospho-beta-glucosidase